MIYLSMRMVVCLFCFVPRDPLNWDASDHILQSLWKALEEEGCMGLVSQRLDLRCKSS